jgi:hypothetical protein
MTENLIACSGCFKKLSPTEGISCEFCNNKDNVCYCSENCRSTVGWMNHEQECPNIIQLQDTDALVAAAYAWQNYSNKWSAQEHPFPAYLIQNTFKHDILKTKQTIIPPIASSLPSSTSSSTPTVKEHFFGITVNGQAVGSSALVAPDSMISEHSANAAAQSLSASRIKRSLEGHTYWVRDKDMTSPLKLKEGQENNFTLTRNGKERSVNVHLIEQPLEHFQEQVFERLSHPLKQFLKDQYKLKGLGSPSREIGTYYGVNRDTGDSVTLTLNKELQLVDLEFFAAKKQSPLKLQEQVYEKSIDDQDPDDIQAIIFALDRHENTEQISSVLKTHLKTLRNDNENINQDIGALIKVRAAISEAQSIFNNKQELIGALSAADWEKRLPNMADNQIEDLLRSSAYSIATIQKRANDLRGEEIERTGYIRKNAARFRAFKAEKEYKQKLTQFKEIRDALDYLVRNFLHGEKRFRTYLDKANMIAEGNVEGAYPGEFQGKKTWGLKKKKEQAQMVSGKINFLPPEQQPIGAWVELPEDPNKVIWVKGGATGAARQPFDIYFEDIMDIKIGTVKTKKEVEEMAKGKTVAGKKKKGRATKVVVEIPKDPWFKQNDAGEITRITKTSGKEGKPIPTKNFEESYAIYKKSKPEVTKKQPEPEEEEEEEELDEEEEEEFEVEPEEKPKKKQPEPPEAESRRDYDFYLKRIDEFELSKDGDTDADLKRLKQLSEEMNPKDLSETELNTLGEALQSLGNKILTKGIIALLKQLSKSDSNVSVIKDYISRLGPDLQKIYRNRLEDRLKELEKKENTKKQPAKVKKEKEEDNNNNNNEEMEESGESEQTEEMKEVTNKEEVDPFWEEIKQFGTDGKKLASDIFNWFTSLVPSKEVGGYKAAKKRLIKKLKSRYGSELLEKMKKTKIWRDLFDNDEEPSKDLVNELHKKIAEYEESSTSTYNRDVYNPHPYGLSHDPTRRNGKYEYYYGYNDEEDISSILRDCFPEEISSQAHFDVFTTPSVLSHFPDEVEEIRELIGADSDISVLKKQKSALSKQLRALTKSLRMLQEADRIEKRGEKQTKLGEGRKKKAAITRAKAKKGLSGLKQEEENIEGDVEENFYPTSYYY